MVKFLNNFLAQVTPFLFYIDRRLSGAQGRLDVGQLVAVIAAYKDLPGPMKELIDWDQVAPGRPGQISAGRRAVHRRRLIDAENPDALTIDDAGPMTDPLSAINLSHRRR